MKLSGYTLDYITASLFQITCICNIDVGAAKLVDIGSNKIQIKTVLQIQIMTIFYLLCKNFKHMSVFISQMHSHMRKPIIWVSDQVRHKQACTVPEDYLSLEILNLRRRGIELSL